MKVLNLRCTREHRFEGWFASEDDFVVQEERGLIACPVCTDRAVVRLPSAPRLNVSRPRDSGAMSCDPTRGSDAGDPASANHEVARTRAQAQWLRAAREAIRRVEDVGDRFPEEARRMHYGEIESRGIRGRASPREAEALRDEGIEITSITLPEALKDSLQ